MKLGVLLPTFQNNADLALATAERAQRAGIDGVFAYDHLFPIGSPERPTLSPLVVMAAVAARLPLSVGTLVARVSLVSPSKLVEQFMTLESGAPGRVIAALGTGDGLSKPEHDAYGLDYSDSADRLCRLKEVAESLARVMPVWIGAGSNAQSETIAVARECGVAMNFWGVSAAIIRENSEHGPVTWAGPLTGDVTSTLSALEDAGATWVVAGTPAPIDELDEWRRSH